MNRRGYGTMYMCWMHLNIVALRLKEILNVKKIHHIVSHCPKHLHVFTDGSKDHSRTACAAVLNKIIHKKALPMESSIFPAEVCAIDLALNKISRDKHNKFI